VYYNCDVGETSHDSAVIGFNVVTTEPTVNFEPQRFRVDVKLPPNALHYFCPPQTLVEFGALINDFFPVVLLSQTPNGMITQGYGYTTSPYYRTPYFLVFRAPQQGIASNYIMFNDFTLSPSFGHILAILFYDDHIDRFQATEYFDLVIPFKNAFTLSTTLEFYIMDSQRQRVKFKNESQLFISISML